ncbi:C-type lectin lectoxin-Lio3-like [Physella acuta]|uniref:C-type lectin lectoxin-Lio3-like n=1 Tax=Physella acuta TaxID=109671 RepID=UPI0027DBD254|nr:C-type lectin lectoxin-Lio3-like [Physella acuta]
MFIMNIISLFLFASFFIPAYCVCPSGWVQRGQSCYYIFEEKLNRSDAGSLCMRHSSVLVSVADQSEWLFVSSLMQAAHLSTDCWTGLINTNGVWLWEDGSKYTEL